VKRLPLRLLDLCRAFDIRCHVREHDAKGFHPLLKVQGTKCSKEVLADHGTALLLAANVIDLTAVTRVGGGAEINQLLGVSMANFCSLIDRS